MLTVNSSLHSHVVRIAVVVVMALAACGAMAQTQEVEPQFDWMYGPMNCPLGGLATIDLPDGYQFLDGKGTRALLELMENPVNGQELGFVMPVPRDDEAEDWFVLFDYNPIGYVRDDDKNKLDADALLKSISEGTEQANEIRRKNGWAEIHVEGWRVPPYYDEKTHNLKWAIIGASDAGKTVNFSVRLLGRGGAMSADLVIDPEDLNRVLPEFEQLIEQFSFTSEHRYAAFREGDKVAKYGLTALVAGGAGAVAMKTGLLAKFWKLIVIGFLALMGSLKRVFGKLFSRRGGGQSRTLFVDSAPGNTSLIDAGHNNDGNDEPRNDNTGPPA
ncbi:MAG: DUF2167 domain-containing protein [bacterium]|nr:DUF2167 domain-containing protein [bacterium]